MESESVLALLTTLVALFFTGMAAFTARDQTSIQRQLRQDAAQPYVWADVEPNPNQGTGIRFVVGNAGPNDGDKHQDRLRSAIASWREVSSRLVEGQRHLAEGIQSLAPVGQLHWRAGEGQEIILEAPRVIHRVTVIADGPFGPVEPLVYDLDLQDMWDIAVEPDGNLHLLTKAVEKLTTKYVPAN